MRRTDSGTDVTVKILVEQNIVSPVRIFLELLRSAINWTLAVFISCKNPDHTVGYLFRHFRQCHAAAGAIRKVNAKTRPIRFAKFSKRLDHQKRSRKPYRPSPI